MDDIKFDLKDISIIPAVESHVNSRKDIDIRVKFSKKMQLPLMAAPMDTVINNDNLERFIIEGIIPCMPRKSKNNSLPKSQYFQSFGLTEIESQLSSKDIIKNPFWEYDNILIDIANGHMSRLLDVVKKIKEKYPDIILMVGNVAQPLTYKNLAMAGADYVRLGIGNGFGCTTASNVAINYPMGSLISECRKEKIKSGLWNTKIVADGGMQGYDDIIKSLALGCFLPNMLIYTSKGFKKIKNISKNDKVLTHKFREKKVSDIFIYENKKDIIRINDIYSTDNHHFYVLHKKYKNIVNKKNVFKYAVWIEAKDLNNNYLLIQNNIKLQHQMQKTLLKIFSKIYIIYLKLSGKLYEKKEKKS